MREWFARIRDWFRRDQLERELAEELRFHQRHLERDAAALGRPPSPVANSATSPKYEKTRATAGRCPGSITPSRTRDTPSAGSGARPDSRRR